MKNNQLTTSEIRDLTSESVEFGVDNRAVNELLMRRRSARRSRRGSIIAATMPAPTWTQNGQSRRSLTSASTRSPRREKSAKKFLLLILICAIL